MPCDAGIPCRGLRVAASKSSAKPGAQWKNNAASRKVRFAEYGELPLSFEANQGQTDATIKFLARTDVYTIFLSTADATLRLFTPPDHRSAFGSLNHDNWSKHTCAIVRLALAASNPHAQIEAIDV